MQSLTLPVRAAPLTEEQRRELFAAATYSCAVGISYIYVIDDDDTATHAILASLQALNYVVEAGRDFLLAYQITPLGLQVVAEWYSAQALLLTMQATFPTDVYATVVLGW